MKVVTDNGKPVVRTYDLVDQFPPGSDIDRLSGDTLRRLVLQIRQKHAEEIASHRKVIREQEAALMSCISDNQALGHDLDRVLTASETAKPKRLPRLLKPKNEDDGA